MYCNTLSDGTSLESTGLGVAPARVLNAIGEAVIVTDLAGSILSWNDAAEAMYGWSAAEVTGLNVVDILKSDGHPDETEEILRHSGSGRRFANERVVTRRDGSTLVTLVTCTPVLDDDGAPVAVIGVSRDVSERAGRRNSS